MQEKRLGNNFLQTNQFSGHRLHSAADFAVAASIYEALLRFNRNGTSNWEIHRERAGIVSYDAASLRLMACLIYP